jgi:hypothetical protein
MNTEVLGAIPIPLLLCAPQISHGLHLGPKEGLRCDLSATKRLSQGTATMLNSQQKKLFQPHFTTVRKHTLSHIHKDQFHKRLRAVSVRLRAECLYVSAQSVRMSSRKVSVTFVRL